MSKVIIITGASSGIGFALAEYFGKKGNKVYGLSRKVGSSDYFVSIPTDITEKDQIDNAISEILKTETRIDVLINNAGISHIGLLQDMTYEQWQHVINTNLSSVFSCCKYALPDMLHKKSGRILNISSVWGNVGASCEVAYSASKGAVNSFTKALAKEVAPSGISVNAIACGTIDTSMNACFSAEERADLESEIPCGRYGTPVETAELAYAIVSQSPYLTGQIITLDGGWC